ncbi:MAG TPA: alkaline phosphatase family protein [Terriglobales bacterium]|nr:alkaline phosphatase family protein [Terriglobales bacterium]
MQKLRVLLFGLLLVFLAVAIAQVNNAVPTKRRNAIIFVADGLRRGSVNEHDAPTFAAIRAQGVDFRNSYSLFPTFTTANASAIATGHALGDTGDFSNTIWPGFAIFDTGNFNAAAGSPVPFIETDQILGDLDDHFHGNYLGEETLMDAARRSGYNMAAIGKSGPTAIQQAGQIAPVNGGFPPPSSAIIIDDGTGTTAGPALPPTLVRRLVEQNLSPEAPARSNGYGVTSQYNNGFAGDRSKAGTLAPNYLQQQWLADVTTKVILPEFEADGKPFVLLFWARDPDATQHNQGDSLGTFYPGINGPTSRAAVLNTDRNLHQILDWLDAHPAVRANTDIIATSDHGFATISRREIDRSGHPTKSEAAQHYYLDPTGKVEVEKGFLPTGFLAIDLAVGLNTGLFDPDRHATEGRFPYKKVRLDFDTWEHPVSGNGLLGDEVLKPDGSDAKAIVASNGGSDLIYVPDRSPETVRNIVGQLLTYDYVGGVFIDDQFGPLPGTLPLSAINLVGSSALPRPAIVVAFKVFYLNGNDLQTAVQVSDTALQEGQGMHGGFGRDSTYNNMAAIGPDFKKGFVDAVPFSNVDIVPTLARLLHLDLRSNGKLQGRAAAESIGGNPDPAAAAHKYLSSPAANGVQTVLEYEEFEGRRYPYAACLVASKGSVEAHCAGR